MSLGNSKDFVNADDFLPTFANLAISGKNSCTIGNTEIKLWQKSLEECDGNLSFVINMNCVTFDCVLSLLYNTFILNFF